MAAPDKPLKGRGRKKRNKGILVNPVASKPISADNVEVIKRLNRIKKVYRKKGMM